MRSVNGHMTASKRHITVHFYLQPDEYGWLPTYPPHILTMALTVVVPYSQRSTREKNGIYFCPLFEKGNWNTTGSINLSPDFTVISKAIMPTLWFCVVSSAEVEMV